MRFACTSATRRFVPVGGHRCFGGRGLDGSSAEASASLSSTGPQRHNVLPLLLGMLAELFVHQPRSRT
eukprot:9489718-Pyramimonas_sp.AAC.1